MELEQRNSPSVIPSSEIPISSPPDDGLEVRPFLNHGLLGRMMPRSRVSLAWSQARPGQDVALRSHPDPSLLIVLEGGATLIGGTTGPVERGDVVTVPRHGRYGFTAIGARGLQVLHVSFARGESDLEEVTLDELLEHNDARGQILLNNPFFHRLRSGRLDTPPERAMMKECLRVFADAFQVLLHTRQATCTDERFEKAFLVHLTEELGHNELLAVTRNPRAFDDPTLRAASAWFCHRMLVLDNVGKGIVNLVLETAGHYLGTLAGPLFAGDACHAYFETHAGADELHKEMGIELLGGQHPDTYRRLRGVLDDTWDMLDVMTRRVVDLVDIEATSV